MTADARITRARSIPFDGAAGYYDRTRAISPGAESALVAQLVGEIRGRRVLEIGVGTGRIAWPLREAGVDLVGLDLSRPMLERLARNARPGVPRFGVLEGDCACLPFPSDGFGAVVASHVFHLVADWADAVAEARRVLAPGGVLLVSRGGWQHLKLEVAVRFSEELGVDKPAVVGLDDVDDLDAHLGDDARAVRRLPVIEDRQPTTLDELIAVLERGQLAWMWGMDPGALAEAGRRTRTWAERTLGDLHTSRVQISQIGWRA